MDILVKVLNRLKLLESKCVPQGHSTVLTNRDDLLLLVEDEYVEDVLAFANFS